MGKYDYSSQLNLELSTKIAPGSFSIVSSGSYLGESLLHSKCFPMALSQVSGSAGDNGLNCKSMCLGLEIFPFLWTLSHEKTVLFGSEEGCGVWTAMEPSLILNQVASHIFLSSNQKEKPGASPISSSPFPLT